MNDKGQEIGAGRCRDIVFRFRPVNYYRCEHEGFIIIMYRAWLADIILRNIIAVPSG